MFTKKKEKYFKQCYATVLHVRRFLKAQTTYNNSKKMTQLSTLIIALNRYIGLSIGPHTRRKDMLTRCAPPTKRKSWVPPWSLSAAL